MLPALRSELCLYRSARCSDGSPTWSLHDPVRNLFFRIDWLAFEILSRWHFGDAKTILDNIERQTPIETEPADFQSVLEFLKANELIQKSDFGNSKVAPSEARPDRGFLRWLVHHYLFFRLPLVRPDKWLERWLPATRYFFTRAFFLMTLFALAIGLILVMRQWDSFLATTLDMFTATAIVAYAVTLACVKVLHELGHAFTAKRYGCHVPTIGVAFIVLFPLAYTDVNDVWRLASRRQRLAVGVAGVTVELVIAAWATLTWGLLPEGGLREAAFLLATTTWVSTLIINASPFMRFDGYFLLMDYLDMPNLHARAFSVGKWQIRRWLFGGSDNCPESLSRQRHIGIVLFAFFTWIYRLALFLGIALVVYNMIPKPIGPLLAAVELLWFVVLPAWREVVTWREQAFTTGRGSRRWVWLLLGSILFAVLPWDNRIQSQGMLRPERYFPVIAPGGALLVSIPSDGISISSGAALATLDVPTLRTQQLVVAAKAVAVRWRAEAASFRPQERGLRSVLVADQARAEAELVGINEELERYQLWSQFDGRFYYADPDLVSGEWVREGEEVGFVVGEHGWTVETYVAERDLQRVRIGDRGKFFPETPGSPVVSLSVSEVDRDAARLLAEPQLASLHGGHIAVRETGEGLAPEQAFYRVRLRAFGEGLPPTPRELRGSVVIRGDRISVMGGYLLRAAAIFHREAGF